MILKKPQLFMQMKLLILRMMRKFLQQEIQKPQLKKNINLTQKMFLILETQKIYFLKISLQQKMIVEIFINLKTLHTILIKSFLKEEKLKYQQKLQKTKLTNIFFRKDFLILKIKAIQLKKLRLKFIKMYLVMTIKIQEYMAHLH